MTLRLKRLNEAELNHHSEGLLTSSCCSVQHSVIPAEHPAESESPPCSYSWWVSRSCGNPLCHILHKCRHGDSESMMTMRAEDTVFLSGQSWFTVQDIRAVSLSAGQGNQET